MRYLYRQVALPCTAISTHLCAFSSARLRTMRGSRLCAASTKCFRRRVSSFFAFSRSFELYLSIHRLPGIK